MYNPINDRINNLMNQKQMIESQLQNIQQLANIPPININNQITPNMALNDFNGKWVNNEQEARNMMVNGLPSIMLDRNDSSLGDLFGLSQSDGANLVLVGHARGGVDASGLLDQDRSRRGLGDEAEGTVSVNSDDNGDDHADLALGTFVELLGERHDVNALLAQSRTNRGSRSCLAGGNLQLNVASDFLCHDKLHLQNLW